MNTITGPENRAVSRLSNAKDNNRGCPANQVSFYVDDDPMQPQVSVTAHQFEWITILSVGNAFRVHLDTIHLQQV